MDRDVFATGEDAPLPSSSRPAGRDAAHAVSREAAFAPGAQCGAHGASTARVERLRRRIRARARERGAALFIVVMVTTLISAIGVYAVRASSQIELASGYSRLWAAAGYVSEFALRMVATDMAGKEDVYSQILANSTDVCRSVRGLYASGVLQSGERVPCYRLSQGVLQQSAKAFGAGISDAEPLFKNVGRPGAPVTSEASANVEVTEMSLAPDMKAGMDLKGGEFQHRIVTVTSLGQVRPLATGEECSADVYQASGVQAVRAHITFMSQR